MKNVQEKHISKVKDYQNKGVEIKFVDKILQSKMIENTIVFSYHFRECQNVELLKSYNDIRSTLMFSYIKIEQKFKGE